MMKRLFNIFDGVSGFAWILILGLCVSLFIATRTALGIWTNTNANIAFGLLVWVTISVAGFIVSLALAYIYHKLLE